MKNDTYLRGNPASGQAHKCVREITKTLGEVKPHDPKTTKPHHRRRMDPIAAEKADQQRTKESAQDSA